MGRVVMNRTFPNLTSTLGSFLLKAEVQEGCLGNVLV